MARIYIQGIKKLQDKLKKNVQMQDVKRVVKKNGAEMTQKMVTNADFNKGYQTGATKRSINLEMENSGLTASAGATTEYAEYLEHGTRFMQAQPFVKPAFDEQKEKFKKDMSKLTK